MTRPCWIAVAVRPDLGECALATDERVVGRHASVVVQAQHLAVVRGQILCRMALQILRIDLAIADGDEEVAVAVERQARPVVAFALGPRLGFDDGLHAVQAVVFEAAADDGRRALRAVRVRLRVTQVDEAVLGEARMRDHIEESALAARTDGGHTGHRRRQQLPVAYDAQPARTLGDEHVAARAGTPCPRAR